jgi:hypothetical protein
MSFNKNPGLWVVILVVVVGYNLYEIFGPQSEAPAQAVVILNWVCVVCGGAGLIGAIVQLMQQQKKREGA